MRLNEAREWVDRRGPGDAAGGGGSTTTSGSSSGSGDSGGSGGGTSSSGSAEAGSSETTDGGLGGTTHSWGTIVGSPDIPKLLALTANCTAANAIASDPGDFVLDNGMVAHVCSLKGGPGNTGGAVYFTAVAGFGEHALRRHPGGSHLSRARPEQRREHRRGHLHNQIEFAVFGDQIAATPGQTGEPIGEASVRTANGLGIPSSPATGGVGGGVTYIAFVGPGSQPADMENIPEVQKLGAQLTEALLGNNP